MAPLPGLGDTSSTGQRSFGGFRNNIYTLSSINNNNGQTSTEQQQQQIQQVSTDPPTADNWFERLYQHADLAGAAVTAFTFSQYVNWVDQGVFDRLVKDMDEPIVYTMRAVLTGEVDLDRLQQFAHNVEDLRKQQIITPRDAADLHTLISLRIKRIQNLQMWDDEGARKRFQKLAEVDEKARTDKRVNPQLYDLIRYRGAEGGGIIRDENGDGILDEVDPLTLDKLRTFAYRTAADISPFTEEGYNSWVMAAENILAGIGNRVAAGSEYLPEVTDFFNQYMQYMSEYFKHKDKEQVKEPDEKEKEKVIKEIEKADELKDKLLNATTKHIGEQGRDGQVTDRSKERIKVGRKRRNLNETLGVGDGGKKGESSNSNNNPPPPIHPTPPPPPPRPPVVTKPTPSLPGSKEAEKEKDDAPPPPPPVRKRVAPLRIGDTTGKDPRNEIKHTNTTSSAPPPVLDADLRGLQWHDFTPEQARRYNAWEMAMAQWQYGMTREDIRDVFRNIGTSVRHDDPKKSLSYQYATEKADELANATGVFPIVPATKQKPATVPAPVPAPGKAALVPASSSLRGGARGGAGGGGRGGRGRGGREVVPRAQNNETGVTGTEGFHLGQNDNEQDPNNRDPNQTAMVLHIRDGGTIVPDWYDTKKKKWWPDSDPHSTGRSDDPDSSGGKHGFIGYKQLQEPDRIHPTPPPPPPRPNDVTVDDDDDDGLDDDHGYDPSPDTSFGGMGEHNPDVYKRKRPVSYVEQLLAQKRAKQSGSSSSHRMGDDEDEVNVGEVDNLPRENTNEPKKILFGEPLQRGREALSEAIMMRKEQNPANFGTARERANVGQGARAGIPVVNQTLQTQPMQTWGLPESFPIAVAGGGPDESLTFVKGVYNRKTKQPASFWRSKVGMKGKTLAKHNSYIWMYDHAQKKWSRIDSKYLQSRFENENDFGSWAPMSGMKGGEKMTDLQQIYGEMHSEPGLYKAPVLKEDGTISKDPYKQGPLPGHR